MREYGQIRHREIANTVILDLIGADIRDICQITSYTPKWAHIVNWFEARPHKYYFQSFLYLGDVVLLVRHNENHCMTIGYGFP